MNISVALVREVALKPPNRGPVIAEFAPTLEQLFREHHLTVAGWAARLGGPAVEVADIVQDVFLIVKRQLPAFTARAKITTWLFKITENVVRTQRRRLRMRHLLGTLLRRAAPLHPPAPLPLEIAEARQARERVYRVLDRLRERDRTLLILFELEGLSGDAVAERLGVKPATLWVLLHRARKRFLKEMTIMDGAEISLELGLESGR